jgi:hypothetical protein
MITGLSMADHRDPAQVDPEGRSGCDLAMPISGAYRSGRRQPLVRFVAVNGLFNLKWTVETAGGSEGRFVSDVLERQFELTATPTDD